MLYQEAQVELAVLVCLLFIAADAYPKNLQQLYASCLEEVANKIKVEILDRQI